jgi:putative transposase
MNHMLSRIYILLAMVGSLFKSRRQLTLENLALLQQLTMLKTSAKRPRVSPIDRLFWVLFSKYVTGWRSMLHALHPDTVVRWHREGFRLYWTWKSRRQRVGRPSVDKEIRKLIRQMQSSNVGWGAPRIHGELLKLGIDISQTTVSKCMVRQQKPPSQT